MEARSDDDVIICTCYTRNQQNTSHIVARANGGVDDSDNYMALSGPFNQLLGKHGDHIMCALAGKTKCKRAVTVSGVDVESEELFESGMATLRQLKKEMKALR